MCMHKLILNPIDKSDEMFYLNPKYQHLIKEKHSKLWQWITFFIFEATMQENAAILSSV